MFSSKYSYIIALLIALGMFSIRLLNSFPESRLACKEDVRVHVESESKAKNDKQVTCICSYQP